MNVTYRTSKPRSEISRESRHDLFSWSFCLESGRDPHVCGNVYGKVDIPQSTRTRTRTRTRASSGGEGRHGGRRGGAKRIARGLKTRKRPQMMVMMAPVAFCALKTKNGAAIAVRDGGHDMGERIQLRGRPRAHRRPPGPIGDAHGLHLVRDDPVRHRPSAAAERLIICQSGLHNLYHHVTKRNSSSLLLPPLFPSP